MIWLLVLAVLITIPVTLQAMRKAKELPDSVSSFSYYVGDVRFSLWITALSVLLLFPMLRVLPVNLAFVGGLVSAGLLMVAASPYYRTEGRVMHYVGGCLFGIASQAVVAITSPWLLCIWCVFPFVFIKRDWRENAVLVSEVVCVVGMITGIAMQL